MRHLGSLLAGLVIAPLAWVLLAFGQTRVYAYWSPAAADRHYPWVEPIVYLVAAGLLLGLLASTRISPVGPLVAGAAYLTAGVAGLASADAAKLLPHFLTISGRRADLRAPVGNGTVIVLGALMLLAVVSAARWRRWPVVPAAEAGGPATAPGEVVPGPVAAGAGTTGGYRVEGGGTEAAPGGTEAAPGGAEGERTQPTVPAQPGVPTQGPGVAGQASGDAATQPLSPPPGSWPPVSPAAEMGPAARHAAPNETSTRPGDGPVGVAPVESEPVETDQARADREATEAAAAQVEAARRATRPASPASAEAGPSPWAAPPSVPPRQPPERQP